MTTELEHEQAALAAADRDIALGRERVARQKALVESGRMRGQGAYEAQRLLEAFENSLAEWVRHRALILQRVVHLGATTRRTVEENGPACDVGRRPQ